MLGAKVGPFRIEAELGSGGMGRVWRARVEGEARGLSHGSLVALKLFHPHLVERRGFQQRFEREAEIGRRVVHDNVVRTLDAGVAPCDGAPVHFLATEYVEGQTLRALSEDLGRVPEELCRHVGREVAKGLAAIHAAGVVHRDLKPENVIISRCTAPGHDHVAERPAAPPRGSEGNVHHRCKHDVKVMDLGVALLGDDRVRVSQTGAFVGSVRYAAPEQIQRGGEELDGRTDLHALGLLLYEMATATHPFLADDVPGVLDRVLHATPRRAGELHPQVSAFLEEILAQLLEKDPSLRPASAEAVARIFEEGESSSWWSERSTEIRTRTRHPLRRIRIQRETRLFGREAELANLRARYERAASGEGAVLLLEGEAGIGKSRLVDEFLATLERRGEELHCLVGGYPPGGAATSSGAFSTAFREHFGEEGSRRWLVPTPILAPAFDALLRGEPAPAGAEPLTKDSLQSCFVHATRALAADRPTIVLIDDLHFAPPEGRALFAALALAVPGHRVLLVGTMRPGLDERWLGEMDRIGAVRTELARLPAADLVRLLADSLRSQHLAEQLAGRIAVKSDGNPFFVFEILRGLREGKFLTRRADGPWTTTQSIPDIAIPDSIRQLVEARVAGLDDASRNLLEVAACVGYEFDADVAAAVLGLARIPALQALGRIEKRHRLVHAAGDRFVFDHHQVQETLYAGLSKPLREEYHAAIGEALEARAGAATKEPAALGGALCADLAEHFLKGAQGSACAGHGAERTGAVPDARTGAGLAGGESGSATARRALRYLPAALRHLARSFLNDAAVALAERALAVPGLLAGGDRWDVLKTLSALLERVGQTDALLAVVEEELAVARETQNRRREIISTGDLGCVLLDLGRALQSLAQFERHLAMAIESGDQVAEAGAVVNLGSALYALGRFADAHRHHERGLELSRVCGYPQYEAIATGNIGRDLLAVGRLAEARVQFERYRELSRKIGDRSCEGDALDGLAGVASESGDAETAESLLGELMDSSRSIGARSSEADALAARGLLRLRSGRRDEARTDFEAALSLGTGLTLPAVELRCRTRLASLPGGDVAAAVAAIAALRDRVPVREAMDAHLLVGKAAGDVAHLREAKRILDFIVAHAPADCRESMLLRIRAYREVVEACEEHGLAASPA